VPLGDVCSLLQLGLAKIVNTIPQFLSKLQKFKHRKLLGRIR